MKCCAGRDLFQKPFRKLFFLSEMSKKIEPLLKPRGESMMIFLVRRTIIHAKAPAQEHKS